MHLVVKLYRRFIEKQLLIGNRTASATVLLEIVRLLGNKELGVTVVELTASKDAMNYHIAEKVCRQRVIKNLQEAKHRATHFYLSVMRHLIHAFIEIETDPLERIYCGFYVLFFTRFWRQYIIKSSEQTLGDHFISLNSYTCIELNAHALLQFLVYCRDSNQVELFNVAQLGSQDCESFFRTLRSMSTTQSTVINMRAIEGFSKIRRCLFLEKAKQHLIETDSYHFATKKTTTIAFKELPGDIQLNLKIIDAYGDGKRDLISLEMELAGDFPPCDIKCEKYTTKIKEKEWQDPGHFMNPYEDADPETDGKPIPNDFITVKSQARGTKLIRKSTALWSIMETSEKVSNDRNRRFHDKAKSKKPTVPTISIGDFISVTVKSKLRCGLSTSYQVIGQITAFVKITKKKNELMKELKVPCIKHTNIGVHLHIYEKIRRKYRFAKDTVKPILLNSYVKIPDLDMGN
jgi:hypothetical protein